MIQAGIDAFNGGDHERLLNLATEDIEWKRVDGLPGEGGTIRGRDALRAHLEPEVFARSRFEIVEVVESDDLALVRGVFHAQGAGSGIELDVEAYVVYRARDGLVWRIENWRTREDAERSSGLKLSRD